MGVMMAQRFGFTGAILSERNTSLYFRAKKSRWGLKDQASTDSSGDFYVLLESGVFLPG